MLERFKKAFDDGTCFYRLPVKHIHEYGQFSTDETLKEAIKKAILDKFQEELGNICLTYSMPQFKSWVMSEIFSIPEDSLEIDWQAVADEINNENVAEIYEFITLVEFKDRPESFMDFLKNVAKAATNNY